MEQQEDGVRESQMTFEMEWSVRFNDISCIKKHGIGSLPTRPQAKSENQGKTIAEGQTLLNLDISVGECLRGGGGLLAFR